VYIMAAYFLVVTIFGNGQSKRHSAIIFISALVFIFCSYPPTSDFKQYILNRNLDLIYEILTCVALMMILTFDRDAWKHLALLLFAVLCHVMIIYRLTIEYTLISHWFYLYYDELLILIGISQMVVSRDGFRTALSNVLVLLRRVWVNTCRAYQAGLLFKQTKK